MKLSFSHIFSAFLVFLPFTQVLTINVGFNLKISELIIIFLIINILNKKTFSYGHINTIDNLLLIFFGLAIVSFFVNMFWLYDYETKVIPYRINRVVDSFLRIIYLFICIVAYFISVKLLSRKISLLDYWIKGAFIAALFGWYLAFSSYLGIPYFKLVGMLESPQTYYGIIRSGPFKEGNFYGLFLLLSATIAFYRKKNAYGFFFLISILSTFSSVTFISAILFLVIFYLKKITSKKGLKIISFLVPIIIILGLIITKTDYYKTAVVGKLGDSSNQITSNNISKVDRMLTARMAFNMGLDNPFFGIGPYNFGNHYDRYNDIEEKIEYVSDYFITFFNRKGSRAIANNVYMEVWAEYGFFGFCIYIVFLIKILFISYKIKERAIFGGYICMLLSMNAFPSYIMLFIWVFLAVPVAIYIRKQTYLSNENNI